MATAARLWIVEPGDDGTLSKVTELPIRDGNQYASGGEPVNGKLIICTGRHAPYVLRRNSVARIKWEVITWSGVAELFVDGMSATREALFDWLANNYPADLEFLIWHPELLNGEFNP